MLELFAKKKENKVLDSSVLVDGRIYDLLKTGFLEGTIVIPLFILEEIQQLADSKDHSKRQKGKKGLDVARKISELTKVDTWNGTIKEVEESKSTDIKLVILCKHLHGKLLTLDHNLGGVAKVHGVTVLSIHDLYLSIRPKLMLGDEIFVKIKEKGKDPGQGRGDYEGTMVVVDKAADRIGQRVKVEVRQVWSQDTGTLVFAKLVNDTAPIAIQNP